MNIKTHIPLICPTCGKMVISKRAEHDIKDAILGELNCDNHPIDFEDITYYSKGQILMEKFPDNKQ